MEFDVSEETALLIDHMHNPYMEYNPEYFTPEQKRNWLEKQDPQHANNNFIDHNGKEDDALDEEDMLFQQEFEMNRSRFKDFDDSFYCQQ